MDNAVGIQKEQITLPGGIWESSTKEAVVEWGTERWVGLSRREEAGENSGRENSDGKAQQCRDVACL